MVNNIIQNFEYLKTLKLNLSNNCLSDKSLDYYVKLINEKNS